MSSAAGSPDTIELHEQILADVRTSQSGLKACRLAPMAMSRLVVDEPSKSYVLDESGSPLGVLMVSSPLNPELIGRSVENCRQAKQVLGAGLGGVILEPLAAGTFNGLSYSIWPLKRPIGAARIIRRWRVYRLRPNVLAWLAEVAERTRAHGDTDRRPQVTECALSQFRDRAANLPRVRDAASQALGAIARNSLPAIRVLQHGDFWIGNILLPLRSEPPAGRPRFYVIDWSGANLAGHPFLDLLQFARTVNIGTAALRREVARHCEILGCSPAAVCPYVAAGLADLGTNLEHFPEERYLELCDALIALVPL